MLTSRRRPSFVRLLAATLLIQIGLLIPLKMALRWAFNLKYFVAFPEIWLSI